MCLISDGHTGICGVRKNRDGVLYSLNYGILSSVHPDPVEKKPLYHFYPGSTVLSIGSYGCNLQCRFCQNHEISQVKDIPVQGRGTEVFGSLIENALSFPGNIGIAYTYNEPVISYEMTEDIGKMVHDAGLKNIMVTNGFINPLPLRRLFDIIDAFNVDLKGFTDSFYHRYTGSRLGPVKEALISIRKAGRHLEVTHLIIPGLNDDERIFREMTRWIALELGKQTILHLSRYFPRHKLNVPPTPETTLTRFFEIAKVELDFVYLGNLYTSLGQDTRCPTCNSVLIRRSGYNTEISGIDGNHLCKGCGKTINDFIVF
jgi:pyruvate formate lyase activating enzyme